MAGVSSASAAAAAGAIPAPLDIVGRVRATTARVMESAKHVSLGSEEAFAAAAAELAAAATAAGIGAKDESATTTVDWDAAGWHYCGDASAGGSLTCQYVFVLDSLNWCFWPSATSMEYDALAVGLRKAVEADPAVFSAERLQTASAADVRSWLAPHDVPEAEERAEMLREVRKRRNRLVLACLVGARAAPGGWRRCDRRTCALGQVACQSGVARAPFKTILSPAAPAATKWSPRAAR